MKRLLSLVVLAPILLSSTPADATTVLRISLEKMTRASAVILHGTVASSQAVAVKGNERHIRTDVTIEITELVKGPKDMRRITLELPGGQLGKYAMKIPGMPSFTAGQEVVLFLEKTAQNWALTGLGQGKFTVYRAADGSKMVRRQLDGIHFVGYDSSGRFKAMPQPRDKPAQTLSSLLSQVRYTLSLPEPAK